MFKRLVHSKWGNPVLAAVLIIAIFTLQLLALNILSTHGILPAVTYTGANSFTFKFQPVPPIPATGYSSGENQEQILFEDNFTKKSNDWLTLSGQVWYEDERLKIAPPLRNIPAFAEWRVTKDALPAKFKLSADLWSLIDFEQTHGLALNLGTEIPIVFLIKSEKQEFAIGSWADNKLIFLTKWEYSDCIQPGIKGNHFEIGCSGNQVNMSINNCSAESIFLETTCNSGSVGAVVLNPGWVLHLDNAVIASK